MGEVAEETRAMLDRLQSSLDLLHGVVAGIDTTQKQMRAQQEIQAAAIESGATKHDDTARILQSLLTKLNLLEPGEAARRQAEEVDNIIINTGDTTTQPASPHWVGDTAGATSSGAAHSKGPTFDPGGAGFLGGGAVGGAGGGGFGGAGGGGLGGAGGGRTGGIGGGGVGVGGGRSSSSNHDGPGRPQMPKMPFPRFDGTHPRIWKDKCHDYFRFFNISAPLWLTTATLHMDGNAAIRLQAYRKRHELGTWPQFLLAVEAEFGADDQRKSIKALLALKQTGSVEEYQTVFRSFMYEVSMHNSYYDEQFFISVYQGVEKRAAWHGGSSGTRDSGTSVPASSCSARSDGGNKTPCSTIFWADQRRCSSSPCRGCETTYETIHWRFWKDRQLRDYRRLHNLCFKCGEKYDPTHQCGQKTVAVVNAMEQTDCHLLLSEEVLNILEMQDIPTLESLLKCNGWF